MLAPCPVSDTAISEVAVEARDSRAATHVDWSFFHRAELANSITHGLGLVLSLLAAPVLLSAAWHGDAWQFTACLIYAASMVSVYAASTCSHWFRKPRLRHFFRMLDQGCIYLFIAGTFTPIAATFLRGGSWWVLPAAIWTVALGGFISKIFFVHRIDCASVIVPVLLGWLPLAGGPALLQVVPSPVIWWMLAGGICYSAGTFFLIHDHRHVLMHSVWHLLVMAGSACHFFAIWQYALPATQS
jgi:hemolysin III